MVSGFHCLEYLGTNWIQLKRFQVLINQTLLLNDHRILNYEYCILNMAKNSPQGKLINQKSTYLLVPIPGRTITTKNAGKEKVLNAKVFYLFKSVFSIHDLMKSFLRNGQRPPRG